MADNFFVRALKRVGNTIIDLSLTALIGSVAVTGLAIIAGIWLALRGNPHGPWFYFTTGVISCAVLSLIFSTSLVILRFRRGASLSPSLAVAPVAQTLVTPTETRLRLQFNFGNLLPLAIEHINMFRWYTLNFFEIHPDAEGKEATRRVLITTIFLVFETPISIKQFRIDGSGAALPRFEIKDSSNRHAVIVFEGSLEGLILDIQVIHL
jgi:hypothetical protein